MHKKWTYNTFVRGRVWFQTPNWQGYTKTGGKRAQDPIGGGNTAARGNQSISVDDTHTRETEEEGGGRRGGAVKHRTVTFRLHQEQDFLIFRARSVEYYPGSLFVNVKRLRGASASERPPAEKRERVGVRGVDRAANRSRLGQFAWAVVCWRSMGAKRDDGCGGFRGREPSAAELRSTGQLY